MTLSIIVILAGLMAMPFTPAQATTRINITAKNGEVTVLHVTDNYEVVSLGTATDPQTKKTVDGVAIIHHAEVSPHKAISPPSQRVLEKCFEHIGKEARWREAEPWIVNGANNKGLDPNAVYTTLQSASDKWEDAADGSLDGNRSVAIFGESSMTTDALMADFRSPDGRNEVQFAQVESRGVVAITVVWGYFRGRRDQRHIIEWDQVYDDVDYDWSHTGEAGKMDFESVATHELGHSAGLEDLYKSRCASMAMFGHVYPGTTNQRNLGIGDIVGISSLY